MSYGPRVKLYKGSNASRLHRWFRYGLIIVRETFILKLGVWFEN